MSMERKLKCKKCKLEWEYNGKKGTADYIEYVTCPRCRKNIPVGITHDKKDTINLIIAYIGAIILTIAYIGGLR